MCHLLQLAQLLEWLRAPPQRTSGVALLGVQLGVEHLLQVPLLELACVQLGDEHLLQVPLLELLEQPSFSGLVQCVLGGSLPQLQGRLQPSFSALVQGVLAGAEVQLLRRLLELSVYSFYGGPPL